MFYVLHEPSGSTTYRLKTDLIACVANRASVDGGGRMVVEITFSGGAVVKLTVDEPIWTKFLQVLHTAPA
jgi:hypothetical protein